jgi:hypothetical protein
MTATPFAWSSRSPRVWLVLVMATTAALLFGFAARLQGILAAPPFLGRVRGSAVDGRALAG